MKTCVYFFLLVFSNGILSSTVQAGNKNEHLPLEVTRYADVRKFKVVNVGKCPIYKLEFWTLPPDSSFLQRLIKSASFEVNMGTLEKGYYKEVPFRDLVNSEGKRLDDNYVIDLLKFKGSYCGEDRYLTLKVRK